MRTLASILTVIIVLAGCASAPEMPQDPQELAPTHGFAFVSVPRERRESPLLVRSLADRALYSLRPHQAPIKGGHGLWLPPGDYQLANWKGYALQGYPSFTIFPGRVTDLGSLVAVDIGGYEFVVLSFRPAELEANITAVLAQLRPFLVNPEPVIWDFDGVPSPITRGPPPGDTGLVMAALTAYERRVNMPSHSAELRAAITQDELLSIAKAAMPPVTEDPFLDGEGNAWYGADFGMLRLRDPEGTWSAIDTGSLHAVTALYLNSSEVVTGHANGEIRRSADSGATWRLVRKLSPDQAVTFIGRSGQRWLLILTTEELPSLQLEAFGGGPLPSGIAVWSGASDDFLDLTIVHHEALEPPIGLYQPRGDLRGRTFTFASHDNLYQLDTESMSLSVIPVPGKIWRAEVSPDAQVITVHDHRRILRSLDHSATWEPLPTPPRGLRTINMAYFLDQERGYATQFRPKFFTATIMILQFDPESMTWRAEAEAPHECVRLMRDPERVPRYCVTTGNSILALGKDGWEVEFLVD